MYCSRQGRQEQGGAEYAHVGGPQRGGHGAAQGIGYEIARVLGEAGASVRLGDIDAEAAEQAAIRLKDHGVTAAGFRCDVTDGDEVAALITRCTELFGPVDIMVNNAGITRDATMRKMRVEDFHAVIDVHLTGAWNGTRPPAR